MTPLIAIAIGFTGLYVLVTLRWLVGLCQRASRPMPKPGLLQLNPNIFGGRSVLNATDGNSGIRVGDADSPTLGRMRGTAVENGKAGPSPFAGNANAVQVDANSDLPVRVVAQGVLVPRQVRCMYRPPSQSPLRVTDSVFRPVTKERI